jgi:hypothetical protein
VSHNAAGHCIAPMYLVEYLRTISLARERHRSSAVCFKAPNFARGSISRPLSCCRRESEETTSCSPPLSTSCSEPKQEWPNLILPRTFSATPSLTTHRRWRSRAREVSSTRRGSKPAGPMSLPESGAPALITRTARIESRPCVLDSCRWRTTPIPSSALYRT